MYPEASAAGTTTALGGTAAGPAAVLLAMRMNRCPGLAIAVLATWTRDASMTTMTPHLRSTSVFSIALASAGRATGRGVAMTRPGSGAGPTRLPTRPAG